MRRFPYGWLASVLTAVAVVLLIGVAPGGGISLWVLVIIICGIGVLALWQTWLHRAQRQRFTQALAAAAARDAVLSDRIIIAGDLHDIVSHGLGAITVRAEAGRRLGGNEAMRALDDVVQLSRQATDELRRLLGVLRAGETPSLTPSPTLDELPGLLDQASKQGVRVSTDLPQLTLAPGVALTAYQVVREGLANTARYGGPTQARVKISAEDQQLLVRVDDDGPTQGWQPTPGAGHGLVLLATRVELLGGVLQHGQLGSGYRLEASIPLGAS